ncbi:phage tail tape measure protein [Tranquillimonas alkanivorans]|uniref:Phage tail tape measure protein, lambda family n=1 Tax=Tranquillimonas alkanivorans TaxID=441119 RepID=A0A1I5QRE1_9RHOB|nr:phage tail tape measure protein [Tranquillimonas alkanivorans]SFP48825.1 hypothetical protein SAMN04488047_10773 [Tranquillimonas alkanivorans]
MDEEIEALGDVVAAFEGELRRLGTTVAETGREVRVLSGGLSRGLRRAFDGMVFDGRKLSDALQGVARSMADAAYSAAVRPVTRYVGGLLAEGIEGAMTAPFSRGRVMPFADGGVVRGPMTFPMRGGTGLMGEAGPEAILPLSRGVDGKLGVEARGGRAVNVVVNVSTPDVEGFRRSQSQVAAQVGRALARGQRNR